MKNLVLLALAITLIMGCKKDNNTSQLLATIRCQNTTMYPTNPAVSGAKVYLYKGINAINHIATYTYVGNGVVKNVYTNESYQPIQQMLSVNGSAVFSGLISGSYSIVVDISNLDTTHKVKDWQLGSINLPDPVSGNKIECIFDIWPYSVSDVGL